MSAGAIFGSISGLSSIFGSNTANGPVSSGPAVNRSIVVNGASGGAVSDLAQLLNISSGPSANGGFTGISANRYTGLHVGTSSNLGLILLGGGALVALLLLRR